MYWRSKRSSLNMSALQIYPDNLAKDCNVHSIIPHLSAVVYSAATAGIKLASSEQGSKKIECIQYLPCIYGM